MDIVQFIGRFHVLVLHLPIGILLMAAVLEIVTSFRQKQRSTTLNAVWLWGFVSAVGACSLGYMLSLGGGYDPDSVEIHKIYGIAVASCALICWLVFAKNRLRLQPVVLGLGAAQLFLLFATGHYGANMTHGPTYLFEYAPNAVRNLAGMPKHQPPRAKPTTLAEADVYHDLIAPMLEQRCTTCHNPDKTKGGLDLTRHESILAGGKSGKAVDPGKLESSELIHRIRLGSHDKKFMPADGKTPLTSEQVDALMWWVSTGAGEGVSVADLAMDADQKKMIANLLGLEGGWPLAEIPPLPDNIRNALETNGFVVKQVAENINYIDLDYSVQGKALTQNAIDALLKAKDYIVWLNLAASDINDETLKHIGQLKNLLKLRLERNPVTSEGVASLQKLQHLIYLNLYGTLVDDDVFSALQNMRSISAVYLTSTKVSQSAIQTYTKDNKKVQVVGVFMKKNSTDKI